MCGIFAWVGPGIDESRLIRSVDRMAHRGPDAGAHWTDGVAWLGHRRLRIIDLSEAGAQPMGNEDGQIQVVFNGEIYNFPELRAELQAHGHVFRSQCDTEVIVHGYEQWGDECVPRFWGMFAFAVWDRRRRRMLVARDRFGKKPLNYLHRGPNLVLASEIPAILETGLSQREVDLESLGFFWQLEYIPAPLSAFRDIRKLPAGHAMAFEGEQLRIWRYYPPQHVEPFTGTYEDAKDRLRELLGDATRRRLVSDVPIGVALSGGVDSANVAAAARRQTSGRLVTVTVRPHQEGSQLDEGDFARATAKALGTEHHEIRPVPDFRVSFETVIGNLGEPFAIASAVPCYYLFSTLRQLATVVITGDGGDELFAGYDHYLRVGRNEPLYRTIHAMRVLLLPDPALAAIYGGLSLVYAATPVMRPGLKMGLAGIQMLRGLPTSDALPEQQRVLRYDVMRRWRDYAPIARWRGNIHAYFEDRDQVQLRMLTEQFDRMTYHILTKVDITSMAHGVEVRSPLLDHRIAEFARGLPKRYLVAGLRSKRILRDLAADMLPREVLKKAKTGFGLDIRSLFARELRGYLTEALLSPHPVYDALVNRRGIARTISAHCAGKPYNTLLLLKLLSLRLWIEQTQPRL